jgi:hypothetical protein
MTLNIQRLQKTLVVTLGFIQRGVVVVLAEGSLVMTFVPFYYLQNLIIYTLKMDLNEITLSQKCIVYSCILFQFTIRELRSGVFITGHFRDQMIADHSWRYQQLNFSTIPISI